MMKPSFLQIKTLCYCVTVIMFAGESTHLFSTAQARDLPPPPRGMADLNQAFKLYLELTVNDYSTLKIIPVIVKGDNYYIEYSKLNELEISIKNNDEVNLTTLNSTAVNKEAALTQQEILILGFSSTPNQWLNLNSVPEIKYQYLSSNQALALAVPAEWMPLQMLGKDSWYKPEIAQSGVGFLNNYDVFISRPYSSKTVANLFTEQRFFSPWGVIKNSGIYSYQQKDNNGLNNENQFKNGYRRYDTNWQYDHQATATTIILGDIISATKNSWGNSIRMGGIQIKRDFGTRPDLITYPLPQFIGEAALPSTVDLIINGKQAQQTDVQSGPFVINNMPFVTGRGEAVIVTTDAVGRQVATSVPFYVSSQILKPGLIDYSFSAGKIRKDFAKKDFSYGDVASSIDARYGLYDWLTLESRTELANDIQLVGLGGVLKIFNYGIFNASYTNTRSDVTRYNHREPQNQRGQKGSQYTLAYAYNQNHFGFNVQHTNRDQNYADLSGLGTNNLISVNSNKITTAQTYFSTSRTGTYGLGYIQTESQEHENKLLNVSWAPVLPDYLKLTTLTLSYSQDLIENDWSAALQLSFPLFRNASTLSTGYNREPQNNTAYVNYNRPVPSAGGFGFDLSQRYKEGDHPKNQARISYRNQYFNTEFGASGEDSDLNYWLGLTGSFAVMDKSLFASNRLGESFALIDTEVADVPVKYENTTIGRSNKNGHIFVPSVSPYYAGKYTIDPLGLSSSYTTALVEQRIAAKRGSGIKIAFPIQHSIAANVYLVDQNNQPLNVGAIVHRSDQESSYVGIDGIAYLTNLTEKNKITVQLESNKTCIATFDVDIEQAKQQIATIENIICSEIE